VALPLPAMADAPLVCGAAWLLLFSSSKGLTNAIM
jgi:hypothetical protein